MKNKKAGSIVISSVVLLIFSICVIQSNENIITTVVGVQNEATVSWGIKRAQNNMQPDVGTANKQLLQDNGGICLGSDLEKTIYLTFDEGYEAGYTTKILDTLKENEVKATFFITAHYLNTASELVERIINEGHIVGNQFPTTVKYRI